MISAEYFGDQIFTLLLPNLKLNSNINVKESKVLVVSHQLLSKYFYYIQKYFKIHKNRLKTQQIINKCIYVFYNTINYCH